MKESSRLKPIVFSIKKSQLTNLLNNFIINEFFFIFLLQEFFFFIEIFFINKIEMESNEISYER